MTAKTQSTKTKTKTSNAKTSKPKSADVTFSSMVVAKAKMLDCDTTAAAKVVRARLRANFAHVCKLDPRIAKAKSAANDGNRWPKVIRRSVAEYVLLGERNAK